MADYEGIIGPSVAEPFLPLIVVAQIMDQAQLSARATKLALLALALAAFGIGTTEFVIMGLLPDVATDLSVSIPQAGLLVSGYALGVAFGGPFLALLAAQMPRKATLAGLMGLFIVGNLGCALAPTYSLLMVARIVTAFCHAAFFGIGAVTAASLVPRERQAQAMALMFSGLTIANILGVPLGTLLGQWAGWRATFWAVVALGVIAVVAILWWLPAREQGERHGLRRELRAMRSFQVWLVLVTSVLTSSSMFVLFTYITPFLRDVTGIAPHWVGGVLLLCGIGITFGNLAGARLADWRPMPSLIGTLFALALILAGLGLIGTTPVAAIITLCLWGALSFAGCTMLQARVVDQARSGPNLASTLNISAFNLGNAIGAWIGGRMIDHGLPLGDIPWAASFIALIAMVIAISSAWLDTRKNQSGPVLSGEAVPEALCD